MSDQEKFLRAEIARLDGEYVAARQKCLDREKELAIYLCPFEIGDTVIGKTMPFNRIEISNIVPSCLVGGYKLIGYKIKKDGGRYRDTTEIWNPENYILVERSNK